VAAGLPGGLWVATSLLLYGWGQVHLFGTVLAWVAHFPVVVLYGFFALWRLPRRDPGARRSANPFGQRDPRATARRSRNPFTG
jgi:peptidoglycan biosynthesis protein MviN/MurJ (putative lipid II flippase)